MSYIQCRGAFDDRQTEYAPVSPTVRLPSYNRGMAAVERVHPATSAGEDYPEAVLASVELVDVMKALSDPVRLQIIRILASGEAMNKSSTDWGCDLSRATMSHHFRILREAGLTLTFVEGRAHRVQLRRADVEARFPGLLGAISASD